MKKQPAALKHIKNPKIDLGSMFFDGNQAFDIHQFDTKQKGSYENREQAEARIEKNRQRMDALQDRLYAQDCHSLLIVFQAMDAAGKDGMVRHVMSGLNPQGTQVYAFKQPSSEDLDHDYLWRCYRCMPERGRIGIFNRSYYEDVLVVRVHNLHLNGRLPQEWCDDGIWHRRFRQINDMERHLTENGTKVLKFFLHESKEEQKQRFLDRIQDPSKNWKFSSGDVKERGYWDQYMEAYQDAINHTATPYAPWHVIPADRKWFARLCVSEFIVGALDQLSPQYPVLPDEAKADLETCKQLLLSEK